MTYLESCTHIVPWKLRTKVASLDKIHQFVHFVHFHHPSCASLWASNYISVCLWQMALMFHWQSDPAHNFQKLGPLCPNQMKNAWFSGSEGAKGHIRKKVFQQAFPRQEHKLATTSLFWNTSHRLHGYSYTKPEQLLLYLICTCHDFVPQTWFVNPFIPH